jgi:DNA-binding GntR family transcriptional regulator
MGLVDSGRDVHAEHQQIYEYAMAGHEARAALALEAHICATPDLLARHGLGLAGALFASPGAAVGSGTR